MVRPEEQTSGISAQNIFTPVLTTTAELKNLKPCAEVLATHVHYFSPC